MTLQHRLACAKTNALPQLAAPAPAPPEPKCKPPCSVLPTAEQPLHRDLWGRELPADPALDLSRPRLDTQGLLPCFRVTSRGWHRLARLPTPFSQSAFSELTGIPRKEASRPNNRENRTPASPLPGFPRPSRGHAGSPGFGRPRASSSRLSFEYRETQAGKSCSEQPRPVCGRAALHAPDPVQSRKLSRVGPGSYWDGRPPGKTGRHRRLKK